jgi:hypothetical protein
MFEEPEFDKDGKFISKKIQKMVKKQHDDDNDRDLDDVDVNVQL